MITEKEFELRRQNFEHEWYPLVGDTGPRLQRMRISDWCARRNGHISENCLFSWLFGNTTPDKGIGGGASIDGIGSVGSFFSYKDFKVFEVDGENQLSDIPNAADREIEKVYERVYKETLYIRNQCIAFKLPDQPTVEKMTRKLKFLDVGPDGQPYSLDRRIVVAAAFAFSRKTWVEEVIVPFYTRDWIAYAARAESNESYASMFAKIFMRRRSGESFYGFYRRLCHEHKQKSMLDSLQQNRQIVLTGAPGTGKTFLARNVLALQLVDNGLVDRAESDWTESEKRLVEERVKLVQFHANYDYSDFVTGLKPVLVDDKGRRYGTKEEIPEGTRVSVSFEWRDGIFKKFADAALDSYRESVARGEPAPAYVLVIDEINRADLSRVFGELFSVLEPGYRYSTKKDNFVELPSGEQFRIPENLFIIGTMNDIDRSVEGIDFALRRRFAWHEISAQDSEAIVWDIDGVEGVGADDLATVRERTVAAMQTLNAVIRGDSPISMGRRREKRIESLGREYELGGAIFKNVERYGKYDFVEKLWDNHISTVLHEYLRGEKESAAILDAMRRLYGEVMRGNND